MRLHRLPFCMEVSAMNKSRYRYRAAIEETIANAKGSRSLETVKASDGATV